MITKVQFARFDKALGNYVTPQMNTGNNNVNNNKQYTESLNSELLKNYYVSFTGKIAKSAKEDSYYMSYDNNARTLEDRALSLAKKYNHKEANHYHVMSIAYGDTLNFIDKFKKGDITLYDVNEGDAVAYFWDEFSKKLFENKEYLSGFEKILKQQKENVDVILEKMPKKSAKSKDKIEFSDTFYNDMEKQREELERSEKVITADDLYFAAFNSSIPEIADSTDKFIFQVDDLMMLEDPKIERLYYSNYDQKAANVLKNLDYNTNMFITYDHKKVNPNSFVPSIIKIFNEGKGRLNPKNAEIVEFSSNVQMQHFTDKLRSLAKNKDKEYIILLPHNSLATNQMLASGLDGAFDLTPDYVELMNNTPKNIHIVAFDAKDNYLNYLQSKTLGVILSDFGEISIPVLNSKDVAKAIKSNAEFMKKQGLKFSKNAIDKASDISSRMDGMYPDKTLNLMKKMSIYYVDKKEITPKDVELYAKEVEHLFKKTNSDNSVDIVFDTGKRLKDIVGKSNTKNEAEYIIKQIKNNKIGTKGFLIYNQDGMPGGGRCHTAEVIAGEAGVPFVSINTMDFGTKEVGLFGDNVMSPEASIKKLFSLVTTQAESNPHKGGVLFIENFEYFSVGEMVSEYHQKAMAQLIREMDAAEKKGLNIVVMGSVSDPKLVGEAAVKSFKFNDSIEVSSPAFNEKERYEVLKHEFKRNKIKLHGTPEEQEKLLKNTAKTLGYFSFIELKSFVKKAESVSQERNHKEVTKSDLTESFLRIVSGRPAPTVNYQHEKELVAKHECGHAITLQVMNDLMKKINKPWCIPDTVNFITLDPRGVYGGAMFFREDANSEMSFEKAFTNIVCSYGGHSSEKYFYGMDGSWGITGDLESATSVAESMVKVMGQGYNTGKISFNKLHGSLTKQINENAGKDITVITKNALTVSDAIVEVYSDFINEFADKYANLVGTGDCLIDGDEFRQELAEWKSRQSDEKLAEIETLETIILDVIKDSKRGKIY